MSFCLWDIVCVCECLLSVLPPCAAVQLAEAKRFQSFIAKQTAKSAVKAVQQAAMAARARGNSNRGHLKRRGGAASCVQLEQQPIKRTRIGLSAAIRWYKASLEMPAEGLPAVAFSVDNIDCDHVSVEWHGESEVIDAAASPQPHRVRHNVASSAPLAGAAHGTSPVLSVAEDLNFAVAPPTSSPVTSADTTTNHTKFTTADDQATVTVCSSQFSQQSADDCDVQAAAELLTA